MGEADKRAQTYSLTHDDAAWLAGACGLPADIRSEAFTSYAALHGIGALANLFAQFIGMANSVVANNREAIELFGIIEGGMSPQQAEKLNLPTIFGACNGAMIAAGIEQKPLCHGCAFRVGALANQSPATTCDADWCSHPGEEPFYCHEDMDEKGDPTKACAGFAQLRAARKRAA